jgi:hypothetical protein
MGHFRASLYRCRFDGVACLFYRDGNVFPGGKVGFKLADAGIHGIRFAFQLGASIISAAALALKPMLKFLDVVGGFAADRTIAAIQM